MLDKICAASEKLFMRYGIKSITMDDVAKDLGISKKTIYQYVSDKDDLVKKTIILHVQTMDVLCQKVIQSEENAILQILKIADMMISMHKEMNQSLLFDLKKFHAETYQMFTEHRENTIVKELNDNIELGIKQGIYRGDINLTVTTGFYIVLVESCLDTSLKALSDLSFAEKYNYLIDYHMNAICTPKGLQFLKEFKPTSSFQLQ
jgi:AcrR family transcriptional regulator